MKSFSAQRMEAIKGVEGKALLDYVVYFEGPLKETIDVCILFASEQHLGKTQVWGTFQLWLKDFDSRWFDQFWHLFTESQVFRQQVKKYYGIVNGHERVANCEQIQKQLDSAAMMLMSQGFKVNSTHVGGAIQSTYIETDHLPSELMVTARQAGFRVEATRISAGGLVCQPIANIEATKALGQLLEEWSVGSLKTANNYIGWCDHIRTCSLVPSTIKVPMLEQSSDVARVVDRSLHGTLTYQDMAKLRSGRDQFSKVNISSLLSLLGLTDVPEVAASFEDNDHRKILRWMCRGLPEGLAIQKVLIDNIRTEEQRQRSKVALADTDNAPGNTKRGIA
tara:strand:+ start:4166 stop:5173 length:1008 start_codon:yes stop_codon:yes gene_type:complete